MKNEKPQVKIKKGAKLLNFKLSFLIFNL